MTKKINFCIFILGILFLISYAGAVGVGSPYFEGGFLRMNSGETKEVIISLQNADVEEGVVLRGELINGSEIASLDRESYIVGYQQEVFANLTIKIPQEDINKKYPIVYKFSQESAEGDGMVQLGMGIIGGFDIVVGEIGLVAEKLITEPVLEDEPIAEEKEILNTNNFNWIIIFIVIISISILFVSYILFKNFKRKASQIEY